MTALDRLLTKLGSVSSVSDQLDESADSQGRLCQQSLLRTLQTTTTTTTIYTQTDVPPQMSEPGENFCPFPERRTAITDKTYPRWIDMPDVVTLVEDLADEGMRPGQISRSLGLTRAEVITILRRTGR